MHTPARFTHFFLSTRGGLLALASLLAGGLAAAAGAAYIMIPLLINFGYRCPFQAVTGLNCPGCGSSRALFALQHGHLWEAFTLNPLLLIGLAAFALGLFYLLWRALRPHFTPLAYRYHDRQLYAGLIVLGAYTVLRNLLGF